jgi:hypothetical protein
MVGGKGVTMGKSLSLILLQLFLHPLNSCRQFLVFAQSGIAKLQTSV